ncbi:MAG: hypothetical protein H8E34_10515 [Bacteroidetes bacterium]|nr:hypothetical protein [Bacteroidota bacterium]
MKKLVTSLFILIFAMNLAASNASQSYGNAISTIDIYYFHYTRRCATCTAVEEETKNALMELYPEKMKTGEISFISVNLDDNDNESLAEKYEVSAQTLLFVSGSETVNLTNKGFMYARSNPDKLKKEIKLTIDNLLSQ